MTTDYSEAIDQADAHPAADEHAPVATLRQALPIIVLAIAIALVCEFIGKWTSPKIGGRATVVVFPMVWALIIGGVISAQKLKPLGLTLQKVANGFVTIAVMVLVARLAFNIGPSLHLLAKSGPALLLQEVGHLLGTVFLALPLAVLLRMGPATIGATFSLDREPSFAMVNEKYGADSDQYRGVLAMYVFGTLFGALYITFLSSLITSMGWFDVKALAMAAGVGSGSMMGAALGSITNGMDPKSAGYKEVMALGALSNLITTVGGVYVGLWVALPLADRFYHLLTGRRDRATAAATTDGATAADNRRFREEADRINAPIHVPHWITVPVITLLGILGAIVSVPVAARIAHKQAPAIPVTSIILGYVILMGLILLSLLLHRLTKKISAIIWVTTIGALISSKWFPGNEFLVRQVAAVDFMSITTYVLAFAGLSLGKDLPILARIGWKIIPVGLVAITASFLLAAVIAEFTLGLWH